MEWLLHNDAGVDLNGIEPWGSSSGCAREDFCLTRSTPGSEAFVVAAKCIVSGCAVGVSVLIDPFQGEGKAIDDESLLH